MKADISDYSVHGQHATSFVLKRADFVCPLANNVGQPFQGIVGSNMPPQFARKIVECQTVVQVPLQARDYGVNLCITHPTRFHLNRCFSERWLHDNPGQCRTNFPLGAYWCIRKHIPLFVRDIALSPSLGTWEDYE